MKKRRKLIQAQHEEEYRNALIRYDKEVEVNEGPDMKEEMMDQLRDWRATPQPEPQARAPSPSPEPEPRARVVIYFWGPFGAHF